MMKKYGSAALVAAAALFAAHPAWAQPGTADNTLFFWDTPLSAQTSTVVRMINQASVVSGQCDPGYCVGQAAAAQVDARNYTSSEEVWILLMGFGKGNIPGGGLWSDSTTVIFDADDALQDLTPSMDVEYPQSTIWNENGKIRTAQWTADFIAGYRAYQAGHPLAGIPDPGYMFFDNEVSITHWREGHPYEVLRMLYNQLEDPRATDEGYPIDGFSGTTLMELYVGAGSPDFEPDEGSTEDNIHMYNLYEGWGNQAREAAMHETVYGPLNAEFGTICSDYDSSVLLDGEGTGPYGLDRKWHSPCGADGSCPGGPFWIGYGQVQSPVLYTVSEQYWDPYNPCKWGATADAANLRHNRDYMTSCQLSYRSALGSWGSGTIIPWITLPNFDIGGGCYRDYIFGHDPAASPDPDLGALRHMAMLASKDITKMIVWFNPDYDTTQQHTDLNTIMEWAYIGEVDSYTVQKGVALTAFDEDAGFYSNRQPLQIDANYDNGLGKYASEVDLEFDTAFPTLDSSMRMEVNLEGWVSTCVSCSGGTILGGQVFAWDYLAMTPGWVSLGTFVPGTNVELAVPFTFSGHVAENYINSSTKKAKIKVRFTSTSNDFVADVDMVQIIRSK